MLYVTERCVFRRTPGGVELIEVAPGIDIERDILGHMAFRPIVRDPQADGCRTVPAGADGHGADPARPRHWRTGSAIDAERDTLFINYEGFQVRTTDEVELVRREVERTCRAIGHRSP